MPGFVPEIELGVDGIKAETGEQGSKEVRVTTRPGLRPVKVPAFG